MSRPLTREQRARMYEAVRRSADAGGQVLLASDPDVQRHRDELVGVPVAPDLTPPEARYIAPGRCLVEWIGCQPPRNEIRISAAIRIGLIPSEMVRVMDRATRVIPMRIEGRTSRTLTPKDGLSEIITWGPRKGTYIREISNRDADRIFASPAGHEFRMVYVDSDEQFPELDLIDHYLGTAPRLADRVRAIEVRVGDSQRLIGVDSRNPKALVFK